MFSLEDRFGFFCQLQVDRKTPQKKLLVLRLGVHYFHLIGFSHIGKGTGTSKMQAKNNAANSFLAHLVQQGLMKKDEIPSSLQIYQMEPQKCFSGIAANPQFIFTFLSILIMQITT